MYVLTHSTEFIVLISYLYTETEPIICQDSERSVALSIRPVEESGTHNNPPLEPELNSCVSECTEPSLPDGCSKMILPSHSPVVDCHRFLLQQEYEPDDFELLSSYNIID